MANLKPWYKVVTPREDLREGKPLDASEFAVHLDQVRDGHAPSVYQDPKQFFERTFLTQNLCGLAAEVIRRLSGETTETSAVFNMSTQFGGGKTHSLTSLYHLAENGPKANGWAGVNRILERSGMSTVPKAATAVFVGTEFDSLKGRGGDDGTPLRKTPWGEIAWQIGGKKALEVLAEHEKQMTAPAGDVIRHFLPKGRPCLILMDELMNYVSRSRKSGMSAQLYNFIENLCEVVTTSERLVLVTSVPKSELEMTAEDVADFTRFQNKIEKFGQGRHHVCRGGDLRDHPPPTLRVVWSAGRCQEDHRRIRGLDRGPSAADSQLVPHRQRPRDLRGHVPLPSDSDLGVRAEMAGPAPFPADPWRIARCWHFGCQGHTRRATRAPTRPVDRHGHGAVGRLDVPCRPFRAVGRIPPGRGRHHGHLRQERRPRHPAGQRGGGHDQERPGCTGRLPRPSSSSPTAARPRPRPRCRRSAWQWPSRSWTSATSRRCWRRLGTSCYYLTVGKNRYRFSLSPNLNKLLADRRANVKPAEIDERVRGEIQKVFAVGSGIERVFFPEKSSQIPDRPTLTFVVLPPDQSMAEEKRTTALVDAMTKEYGTSSRTFKSALIWCVPDSPTSLAEEARKLLAWESIDEEDSDSLDDAAETAVGRESEEVPAGPQGICLADV